MIYSSGVVSQPRGNMFQGYHGGVVSQTTYKPQAFRVSYHADGTGRDTFVKMNNGGFYKSYTPAPADPVTRFTQKRKYDPPAPALHSRPVQYHSDGSGRDSYIGFN